MERVLEGVRVVEVSAWAFVPSAGAVLADWGADVVKIEPPTGDPIRGLVNTGIDGGPSFPWEIWNRGKRSVALDLTRPKAWSTWPCSAPRCGRCRCRSSARRCSWRRRGPERLAVHRRAPEVQVQVVLPRDRDAAVELHALLQDVQADVADIRLGRARLDAGVGAAVGVGVVEHARGRVDAALGGLQLEQQVGDPVLERLERRDRPPKANRSCMYSSVNSNTRSRPPMVSAHCKVTAMRSWRSTASPASPTVLRVLRQERVEARQRVGDGVESGDEEQEADVEDLLAR